MIPRAGGSTASVQPGCLCAETGPSVLLARRQTASERKTMNKLATIGALVVALAIPANAAGKSIPRLHNVRAIDCAKTVVIMPGRGYGVRRQPLVPQSADRRPDDGPGVLEAPAPGSAGRSSVERERRPRGTTGVRASRPAYELRRAPRGDSHLACIARTFGCEEEGRKEARLATCSSCGTFLGASSEAVCVGRQRRLLLLRAARAARGSCQPQRKCHRSRASTRMPGDRRGPTGTCGGVPSRLLGRPARSTLHPAGRRHT